MAVICRTEHDVGIFSWNQATRTFTAFASDFGRSVDMAFMSRVYDDACDEGFWIFNPKTGRKVLFVLHETVVNDGDLQLWEFHSNVVMHGQHKLPRVDCKVVIFND